MSYALLDSGGGEKLERFGAITLIRPCAPALWHPKLDENEWEKADARFSREEGNQWEYYQEIPSRWQINVAGIDFWLKLTDFGHLGLFPEHAHFWKWIETTIQQECQRGGSVRLLNLFAYSGGATLAAAKGGASVTHLDASKGMVGWARENAALNKLEEKPVRWIVDDVRKYLARALRRGERYEAIVLDPPTFGRGKSSEIFKIEEDLPLILDQCVELLSDEPLFLLLSCHTAGYTSLVLEQLLRERLEGHFDSDALILEGPFSIPSGTYARWKR